MRGNRVFQTTQRKAKDDEKKGNTATEAIHRIMGYDLRVLRSQSYKFERWSLWPNDISSLLPLFCPLALNVPSIVTLVGLPQCKRTFADYLAGFEAEVRFAIVAALQQASGLTLAWHMPTPRDRGGLEFSFSAVALNDTYRGILLLFLVLIFVS